MTLLDLSLTVIAFFAVMSAVAMMMVARAPVKSMAQIIRDTESGRSL